MNSILDFIKNNAKNYKSKTVLLDERKSLTNYEFLKQIKTTANLLTAAGIKEFHKIILISENSIDFFILFFSLKLLKSVPILINTTVTSKELDVIYEESKPNFVFFKGKKIEKNFKNFTNEQILSFDYFKTDNTEIDNSLQNVGVMLHTSGTSGNIKIVALSEKNLLSGAIKTKTNRSISDKDILYLILPVTFVFGLNLTLGMFYSSACIFVATKFKRNHIKSFEKNKITMLSSTPITLLRITSIMKEYNISASFVRYVSYGGDYLSNEHRKYIEEFFNLKLVNGYGMTETTATISINDGTMHGVGKIITGLEIKFISSNLNNANEGIINLKGETIGLGYYQYNTGIIPFSNDGWFNTGDYGKLIDNNLILIGRYKDLFFHNNLIYNPATIENEVFKIINKQVIIAQHENKNIMFVKQLKEEDKYVIDNFMSMQYNINNLKYCNLKKIPISYNGKIKRSELIRKYFNYDKT